MRPTSAVKPVQAIAAAAVNGDSFAAIAVDTKQYVGFYYAQFVFAINTIDIGITALKLQECDTSGGSYTDIPNADFSAHLPTSSDGGENWVWNVQLGGSRKRFIKVVATVDSGVSGCLAYCHCTLANASEAPFDAVTENAKYILDIQ